MQFIQRRAPFQCLLLVFFRPPTPTPPTPPTLLAETMDIDIRRCWDAASDHNMGVRLEGGHLELNIKSLDDAFAHALFLAASASKH